ncbi:FGGY family carbohydrate kinase [Caulobacter segnis]
MILAIDQGTTNTKALLVDADARIVARASRPMTLTHPRPGWTEQNAEHIWASVAAVIEDLVTAAPGPRIAAVAISNQRETIVAWSARSGRPRRPRHQLAMPALVRSVRAPAGRGPGGLRVGAQRSGPGLRCSRPPSWPGCWKRSPRRRAWRPAATCGSGRSTAGCCGT